MTRTIKVTFKIDDFSSAINAAKDVMHLAAVRAGEGSKDMHMAKEVLDNLEKLPTPPVVGLPLRPQM